MVWICAPVLEVPFTPPISGCLGGRVLPKDPLPPPLHQDEIALVSVCRIWKSTAMHAQPFHIDRPHKMQSHTQSCGCGAMVSHVSKSVQEHVKSLQHYVWVSADKKIAFYSCAEAGIVWANAQTPEK